MEGKLVAKTIARLAERDSLDIPAQQRLFEMVETFDRYFEGLGFCLSAERDLLSQWRGYAADATGVAIGFSKSYLDKLSVHLSDSKIPSFSVKQVHYDPSSHEAEVEPAYREARKFIEQGAFSFRWLRGLLDNRTDEQIEQDRKNIENKLMGLSITLLTQLFPKLFLLKSPAFKEEREWRLITHFSHSANDQCLYRTSDDRVIPFRKFDLHELSTQPIVEIILGPKHVTPPYLIEHFLKQFGFDEVKVLRSEASYR